MELRRLSKYTESYAFLESPFFISHKPYVRNQMKEEKYRMNEREWVALKKECRSLILKRAALSGVMSLVPIPGIDMVTDTALLMNLFKAINRRFGLTQDQIHQLDTRSKTLVFNMVTKTGNKHIIIAILRRASIQLATKSIVKFIPIIGQLVAVGLSFVLMRALGNAHINDCYRIMQSKELSKTR